MLESIDRMVTAALIVGSSAWLPWAALGANPEPGPGVMRRLAADRGCYACHAELSPGRGVDAALVTAPSWQQVATRYRNFPEAEARLVQLVLTGSDPGNRHWKGDVAFDRMMANEIATTPEEARALVHWILSFR